jgi:hypothetical protein
MAVCKLAIHSFIYNEDLGGYDIHDLKDCIAFGQWELDLGHKIGFDGQDWRCFIKWAKHKIKEVR